MKLVLSLKYKHISFKILVLTSLISLFSCAQEQLKAPESDLIDESVKNKSVSKSEREKYRSGITALYNNNLSKAQSIFSEFVRNKPELAGGYTNLALIHFKKKEYKKALKHVNKALKLNPKQAQALNLRAQLFVMNGKIHEAKKDYLLAIKSKPKYANAQYNLALLYDIYLQEIKLAIKHYKTYLSLLKEKDLTTEEWITHLEGTLKND